MGDLTPQAFATKWAKSKLSESSASHQHFIDLCRMLGQPAPADVDSEGRFYTSEKGVAKTGAGGGARCYSRRRGARGLLPRPLLR